TGRCRRGRRSSSAMPETKRAWAAHRRASDRRHNPFRRLDRRAGPGFAICLATTATTRSTPAPLIEAAVKAGVRYLIFSSTAAIYGNPQRCRYARTIPPCRPRSMRAPGIAQHCATLFCVTSTLPAPTRLSAPGNRPGRPPISSRLGRALGRRPKIDVFGADYPTHRGGRRRDVNIIPNAGAIRPLNCGYGRGFSVLDVIDTVKRVAGVDFKIKLAPRRAGDPAQIVAACDRTRSTLVWLPRARMGARAFET